MKKRRSAPSSFELFLDTICNVFGGIVFIAMLIAIQIRQPEGILLPMKSSSPEKIAEMRQELDKLSADIALSEVLLETLQTTMPKPKDTAEQELTDKFYKLSSAQGAAAAKKADMLNKLLAEEQERLDWEDRIKDIEATLQQTENERQKLKQEVVQQQQDQQTIQTSLEKLQSEIDELNRQIAQKERNLNDNTNRQRTETVYLPKLRDAGNKRPVHFVLRFNRFYRVSIRSDFDYTGNALGIPKKSRGIPVENLEGSKRQIQSLFQDSVSNTTYLSVFVYGDSAEQWYIIRDVFVSAGFEYELIPTADDTEWIFGGSSGSASVQ